MKKLIVVLLFTVSVYSQDYNTSLSFYSDNTFSKGIELRGEFENWYLSLQGEYHKEKLNWGFSLGNFNNFNKFTWFYGLKTGFINKNPNFGAETELDYNLKNFFIGFRLSYDVILPKEDSNYQKIRPFLKVGFKLN